jgi:SAM-dependent methyltransferase
VIGTASSTRLSRLYPEVRFGGFSDVDGTVRFYSRVAALIRPEWIVIDFGCGRGAQIEDHVAYRANLRQLRGRVRKIIGLDVDPNAAVNPFIDEFRVLQEDVQWPISSSSTDCVIADFVLEHLKNPATLFSEAQRVLRPGGYLCARTPNRWGYVALCARLVPTHFHSKLLAAAQPDRRSEDVFRTYYRSNSRRTLMAHLTGAGFDGIVYDYDAEPAYAAFSASAMWLCALLHRLAPRGLRSTLLLFAVKL